MHALALASARGGTISATEAAAELSVSPSYLGKVLQAMTKSGILSSSRGAAGGFTLEREASTLSCREVLECLDGSLPERDCLFAVAVCQKGSCAFSGFCAETAQRLAALLERTSVSDIAACFDTGQACENAPPPRASRR